MQPYLFPYIGYWQLINAVDKYVIYDDVNFIKGGWINRNNILINGEAKLITLQLDKATPNKLINEIEVLNNYHNKKKMLKAIENSYKKAPYYNECFPMIKDIILNEEKNLVKFIANSLKKISEYLEIKTEFIVSSEIMKDNNLKGQDKVIQICKILSGDEYINAIGGQVLYSKEDFKKCNLNLSFLKPNISIYKQFENKFIPNLSIIDLLMFNSVKEMKEILNDFTLID